MELSSSSELYDESLSEEHRLELEREPELDELEEPEEDEDTDIRDRKLPVVRPPIDGASATLPLLLCSSSSSSSMSE